VAATTKRERQQAEASAVWHRQRAHEERAERDTADELVSAGWRDDELVSAGSPPKPKPPAPDVDDFAWGWS
jgi:hypothetical protein